MQRRVSSPRRSSAFAEVLGGLRVASLVGLVGCTPTSPDLDPKQNAEVKGNVKAEPAEPVEPQPPPKPKPVSLEQDPPEPPPNELRQRVEDLAVVREGEVLGTGGVQCWARSDWAIPSEFAGPEDHPVKAGDPLYAIAASGVSEVKTVATKRADVAVKSKTLGPLFLAAKDLEPRAGVRLEPRRLGKPSEDVAALAAWIEKRVPYEVKLVGEIEGSFGGGVDRIAVFEPVEWNPSPDPDTPEDEEPEWEPFLRSEIALLVAASEPQGWLPFGVADEDEAGLWESGAYGLQVFGVLDLDGDGTLEVAWLTQMPWGDPLTTAVTISYYDPGRGFEVWDVGGCSYNGCEAFLPRKRCRGIIKREPRASRTSR